MHDFVFHNPTRIVFGKDVVDQVGRGVRPLGDRVLLVTGQGSVRRSGLYDRVRRCLAEAGITAMDLDGVISNPVISRVQDGIALVRELGLKAVLAVGGGSVMDSAKAIAAGALLPKGDVWDVFTRRRTIASALPIVTVPTLAASGSEMNGYMVITNEETGHKLAAGSEHLYPKVSLLDPTATFSVPADYTAYGGADAVCHLLEPYFNGPEPHTSLQDRLAEGLISTILDATEGAIARPTDYRARATLMWGATLALCGLSKAGVGDHYFPVHSIEHSLSALFRVPHGAGLAALLPGWMSWWSEGHPTKPAQLGRRVWGLSDMPPRKGAFAAIGAFSDALRRIGCSTTLAELGIHKEDHHQIAENAFFQAKLWGIEDHYPVETIETILGRCQG